MWQKKEETRGGFIFEVWTNRPSALNGTKVAVDWLVGYESVWIRILCLLQREIWGLVKIKERNTPQSLTWSQLDWATFCLRRTKWKAGRATNQHLKTSTLKAWQTREPICSSCFSMGTHLLQSECNWVFEVRTKLRLETDGPHLNNKQLRKLHGASLIFYWRESAVNKR